MTQIAAGKRGAIQAKRTHLQQVQVVQHPSPLRCGARRQVLPRSRHDVLRVLLAASYRFNEHSLSSHFLFNKCQFAKKNLGDAVKTEHTTPQARAHGSCAPASANIR
jgi:hypothetical protein